MSSSGHRITISVGTPADLEAVAAVERRCFVACRRSSIRALRYGLRSPTQTVLIAWAKSAGLPRQVAGVLILHRRPQSIRIYSLAVMPAFRGDGLGSRLVQKAVAEARRHKSRYVSLEADRRNTRLVNWYLAQGFAIVGYRPDYYSEGRDAVLMRWVLRQPVPAGRRSGS